MNPECMGPLVPVGTSVHPACVSSHCRLLLLHSIAAFLGYPSCGSSGLECIQAELWENDCSHQDFKGQSLLAHAWAQDSNPGELRDQGENCYPTTQPWVPACPLVDVKGRTPILGGLEGKAYRQRELQFSLNNNTKVKSANLLHTPKFPLFHSRKPRYNFTVSPWYV